jgi:hypothetical protein
MICKMLVSLAPAITEKSACLTAWGEPEVPENF